jgi:hypothetical protein
MAPQPSSLANIVALRMPARNLLLSCLDMPCTLPKQHRRFFSCASGFSTDSCEEDEEDKGFASSPQAPLAAVAFFLFHSVISASISLQHCGQPFASRIGFAVAVQVERLVIRPCSGMGGLASGRFLVGPTTDIGSTCQGANMVA